MTESPEPWASDVFVDEAEQEAADQYETALLEAEIKKGRLMVRAICGSCDQEKGGRNVTVARVFDSPLGPFWRSEIFLSSGDFLRQLGERNRPSVRGVSVALLAVVPRESRRRANGQAVEPRAWCKKHKALSPDEAAIAVAIDAYRTSGNEQVVRLRSS